MKLKCLFKGHKWGKIGGPVNVGDGEFEQKLICKICNKIKYYKR